MAPTIVHFELPAQDGERAQNFYSKVFGWQFQDAGMPGIDYRMIQGEPGGAVYSSDSGGTGVIVYFGTDDIEGSLANVRDAGGEAEDTQPIPGIGWFARCKDTEGNAFSFFQRDESVPPPGQ